MSYISGEYNSPKKKKKQPKLGSGQRFKNLVHSLESKGNVSNPAAVAAKIGREKYGKKRFQKLAAKGRKK